MNAFIEHHQQAIALDYSCFDRILLNAVIQVVQNPAAVAGFLKEKRQAPPLTPAYFRTISTDYTSLRSRPRRATAGGNRPASQGHPP